MSDSSDGSRVPSTRVLDWVERYYHVVVLALLIAFMFLNRIRTWGRFVQDGEVLFRGNDPWYHYRQVSYTVEHWPSTMPFDPWTYFPNGNASGQFGTLFDQLIATVALVIGLGNPDQNTVALVTLVSPVLFAVLVAVPVYYIGKRLGGRLGGVVAVTVLALASGRFLTLTLVGFPDHHVAETLFQSVAILGVMVALSVAARDKPIYEQVRALDVDPLRGPLGWGVLAGISITLYLWVWPFGALLLGILGVFFVVQICVEFVRGESPEHTAFVGAVALSATGVLALASTDTAGFVPSELSLLQPTMALAVAVGCVFMGWLARTWEKRDLPTLGYPAAILATVVTGIVAVALLAPDLFETFYNNIVRVFGFWIDPTETGRTVAEVQPLPRLGLLFENYGFAIIIAAGAALWILGRTLFGRRVPPEQTLVVVWGLLIGIATVTQQRFGYYLIVPVAVLAGYAVGELFRWLDLSFDPDDVEFYQVVSVAAVILVIVVPLVIGSSTALQAASANGPGQDVQAWSESLDWMQENTPQEGLYADGSTNLSFYGTYDRTDDFEYEPGAYGVISWWDYGHWITQLGKRIPHANPHQQGANTVANYLLAGSEEQADDALEQIDEDERSQNRYVVVDWKMANSHTSQEFLFLNRRWGQRPNGKFFAPIQFYDAGEVQSSDYFGTLYYESPQLGFGSFNYHKQAYYETQVVRLYRYHGSAAEPRPVVLEWAIGERQGRQLPMTSPGTPDDPVLNEFDTIAQARAYVENNTNARVGGIGGLPSERVPALEHYRLVSTGDRHASDDVDYRLAQLSTGTGTDLTSIVAPGECSTNVSLRLQQSASACLGEQQQSQIHQTASQWTKVFERVPGATVEGTGPSNATVRGQVEMYNPAANETFTYHQVTDTGEDGTFNMTVPYSTTGYENWGTEEGRTNVSVRATGEYNFQAFAVPDGNVTMWNGSTAVPESAVIGETDEPVAVELSEVETSPGDQAIPGGQNGTNEAGQNGTNEGGETSERLAGTGDATDSTDESGSPQPDSSDAGLLAGPARSGIAVP